MSETDRQKYSDWLKIRETALGKELLELFAELDKGRLDILLQTCARSSDRAVQAALAAYNTDGRIIALIQDVSDKGQSHKGIPVPRVRSERKEYEDYTSPVF